MWGQGLDEIQSLRQAWIIPTRVGTSHSDLKDDGTEQDHPHACGDKQNLHLRKPLTQGSSPRVWGQGCGIGQFRASVRIIPTRVGTSCYRPLTIPDCQDHPHACGDKQLTTLKTGLYTGSSPRVWGQAAFSISFSNNATSSPRVWGQVTRGFKAENGLRIIPTRVGTSPVKPRFSSAEQDHPHACGDKYRTYHSGLQSAGSSPRVWGQVRSIYLRSVRERIIPTRVGTR